MQQWSTGLYFEDQIHYSQTIVEMVPDWLTVITFVKVAFIFMPETESAVGPSVHL